MSYILDALRKSDQQRRLGATPTLPTAPTVMATAPPKLPFYGLLGAGLIAVGMAIGWLGPWQQPPPVLAPLAASTLESLPRQTTAPPPPAATVAAAAVLERAAPLPKRTPLKAAAPAVALISIAAKPRDAPTPKAQRPADQGTNDDASEQKPIAGADLPLSIQHELPRMAVAVHAYSNKPQDRLVSINNRLLREGDTLAPDLKLEQITPDGMVFSYRGYRFRRGL